MTGDVNLLKYTEDPLQSLIL